MKSGRTTHNRPPNMPKVRSVVHDVAFNRMVSVGNVADICDGDMLDGSEMSAVQMFDAQRQPGRKDVSRRDLVRLAAEAAVIMAKREAADYFGPPQFST